MTKDELKEYAAANRRRLKEQKVALGDLVMILVGDFAGEDGVVKGISVCGNDFTDPYYEVDMHREVPEKYKCRKTIVGNGNMIGGLSASDFEVIANRTPEADIKGAEPTPKFKVGDRVIIDNVLSAYDGEVGTIALVRIGETVDYGVKIQNDIITFNEDSLAPYTEPTAEEDGGGLSKYATGQTVLLRPAGTFHKIKSICYRGNKFIYTMESGMEFEENVLSPLPESVPKIELTPDWQSYRMELAAKIAVVLAQKGRYEPSEIGAKAVEVANGVINGLKNTDI